MYRRALGQLLGRHHLHVHVAHLGLAARLDQALEHLGRRDLDVDDQRRQRRLHQLRRVVDGVAVEHDQLHRPRQLEDALDLRLRFHCRHRKGERELCRRVTHDSLMVLLTRAPPFSPTFFLVVPATFERFTMDMSAWTRVMMILKPATT